MNTPKHFPIPITTPLAEFKIHLEDPGNHRIFFNGKFGTGKTYFLNEFFNDTNEFKAIHLYPVNYQVNSNEDIFELIKYDILLELVGRGWFEGKDELTKSLAVQSYILNEGSKTALKLLKCIPKIGKVVEAGEHLTKFITGFQEYENQLNKNKLNCVTEFVKNLPNKQGSHYEYDQISQVIRSVVEEMGEKKLCLVIDDLDRIDPEHIFRILNVFSAHFDLHTDHENKFGFAKIIVVGDIDNIRNIFKAKYGMDADFNGYVDKFYSKKVFNFDNSAEIAKTVQLEVRQYAVNEIINKYYSDYAKRANNIFISIIQPIIITLVLGNRINLRDIQRLKTFTPPLIPAFNIKERDINGFDISNFDAPYIISILLHILGNDVEKFIEVFSSTGNKTNNSRDNQSIISELLFFNQRKNLSIKQIENNDAYYTTNLNMKMHFEVIPYENTKYYRAYFSHEPEKYDFKLISNKFLFETLIETLRELNFWNNSTKYNGLF